MLLVTRWVGRIRSSFAGARKAACLAGLLVGGEKVGAGPARVRHAHSAWSSAMRLPHGDGTAMPDLRHDHLVCVVNARADRPFLASQSSGVPVCSADCSAFFLVGLECSRERAGPVSRASWHLSVRPGGRGSRFGPRVLVDSIDGFAQRSGTGRETTSRPSARAARL